MPNNLKITSSLILLGLLAGCRQTPPDAQLFTAIRDGDVNAVQTALDKGASLEKEFDHRSIGQSLSDKESRLSYGKNPLVWAVAARQPEVVKALLQRGAKPQGGHEYNSALHWAARDEKLLPSLKLLLNAGANPNAQLWSDVDINTGKDTFQGSTPLMEAVKQDNLAAVKVLLQHGARPEVRTADGKTALSFLKNLPRTPQDGEIRRLLLKDRSPRHTKVR